MDSSDERIDGKWMLYLPEWEGMMVFRKMSDGITLGKVGKSR